MKNSKILAAAAALALAFALGACDDGGSKDAEPVQEDAVAEEVEAEPEEEVVEVEEYGTPVEDFQVILDTDYMRVAVIGATQAPNGTVGYIVETTNKTDDTLKVGSWGETTVDGMDANMGYAGDIPAGESDIIYVIFTGSTELDEMDSIDQLEDINGTIAAWSMPSEEDLGKVDVTFPNGADLPEVDWADYIG